MCNLLTYYINCLNIFSEFSQKKVSLQSTVIYFDHKIVFQTQLHFYVASQKLYKYVNNKWNGYRE